NVAIGPTPGEKQYRIPSRSSGSKYPPSPSAPIRIKFFPQSRGRSSASNCRTSASLVRRARSTPTAKAAALMNPHGISVRKQASESSHFRGWLALQFQLLGYRDSSMRSKTNIPAAYILIVDPGVRLLETDAQRSTRFPAKILLD